MFFSLFNALDSLLFILTAAYLYYADKTKQKTKKYDYPWCNVHFCYKNIFLSITRNDDRPLFHGKCYKNKFM